MIKYFWLNTKGDPMACLSLDTCWGEWFEDISSSNFDKCKTIVANISCIQCGIKTPRVEKKYFDYLI